MIEVTTKERIRHLHLVQGWSQRRVARELGISRDTVAKYLQEEPAAPPHYRLTKPRPQPVSAAIRPMLQRWLEEDEQQPRKQRRTAHQMWVQLSKEYGFTGSEPVVRLRVRELKQRRREVFIPLAFGPGERAEVDWGTAQVLMAGQVVTAHLFCARLRYANLPFVRAFPHEQQEALFAGHRAAFEYWGAVPRELSYDNLSTAVRTILTGHRRTEQAAFVGLKMTYLFEAVFCNVAAGHEKGNVENLVGTVRRQALSPMPVVGDWDDLNARLLAWCAAEQARTLAGQTQTIGQRWAEERRVMLPLPERPFDCSRRLAVTATKTAEVRFATNRYSVPVAYAYQPLVLKADVQTVRIYHQTTLIAEHARCYGRQQVISDWRHYLPALAQKPAAVPHAAALRQGALPTCFETFRQGLCAQQPDGNRAFVRVLELAALYSLPVVSQAVETALAHHLYQVAAVEQWVVGQARETSPPAPLDPARYPAYAAVQVAAGSVAAYQPLLASPPTPEPPTLAVTP